jgi:CRP-like cAMP-binding protein
MLLRQGSSSGIRREPMSEDLLEMLGSVPLFAGLGKKELKSLAASGKEIDRPVGDVITTEGESGIAFFLIMDGAVEISSGGRTLRTLGRGDHFGEISLIDGGPRTATVTVTEAAHLFGVTAWSFKPLLSEHPEMAQVLLINMCKMIRSYEQT